MARPRSFVMSATRNADQRQGYVCEHVPEEIAWQVQSRPYFFLETCSSHVA
jgi:hypothetical protein